MTAPCREAAALQAEGARIVEAALAMHLYGVTPKLRYRRYATEEAERLGIEPEPVFCGAKSAYATLARWRAWQRLHDEGYGLSGIGRAAGMDHTSVLWALRRIERREIRAADQPAAKPKRAPMANDARFLAALRQEARP